MARSHVANDQAAPRPVAIGRSGLRGAAPTLNTERSTPNTHRASAFPQTAWARRAVAKGRISALGMVRRPEVWPFARTPERRGYGPDDDQDHSDDYQEAAQARSWRRGIHAKPFLMSSLELTMPDAKFTLPHSITPSPPSAHHLHHPRAPAGNLGHAGSDGGQAS